MTKPCRAASSSMFSLNINFWCFSFVTLFNLQGTRPSASAAERALSYHVVRLLSSTFFNFFEVFSALNAAFRRSLRQLIYFTRAFQVCQALFTSLKTFALDAGSTAAFQTACLLYQTTPTLSIPFFEIFPLFFRSGQRHFSLFVI